MLPSDKKIKLGIICGGPSLEKGISLNSARSLLDHLPKEYVEISPFYVDYAKNFHSISKSQLYSNTPQDFDFKLQEAGERLSEEDLIKRLKELDIVFPVIHGAYGEDGELQEFLEKHGIKYIGSTSSSCYRMFHKNLASMELQSYGLATLPSVELHKGDPLNEIKIAHFFNTNALTRAIIKPIAGGSSIGVTSVTSIKEAMQKASELFDKGISDNLLLEAFCRGREFTVIVLESHEGKPVALIPSEIEVSYEDGGFFDYRRKYLPTANTKWPCPPNFAPEKVSQIQEYAEFIFKLFNMRDFVRLDGWLADDGKVIFSDLNPISGLEQNSFIFQQSARVGLKHRDILWYVLQNAFKREGIDLPSLPGEGSLTKEPVFVLLGGATAERQVSLMSGSNVWLKLLYSKKYTPKVYFLDTKDKLWQLPYPYVLNHTVEEVEENCVKAHEVTTTIERLGANIRKRLCIGSSFKAEVPESITWEGFLSAAKQENAFVFLGLHGGKGEDGTIQALLDEHGIKYNGSGPEASKICINKKLTGEYITAMEDPIVASTPKLQLTALELAKLDTYEINNLWDRAVENLGASILIIKPELDGCSAGIIRLSSADDLKRYVRLLKCNSGYIPANTFSNQSQLVELPLNSAGNYILEPFIQTDIISVKDNSLSYSQNTGWLELTVGVLESKGNYYSLNPSITVADNFVLSLEEKFQGGTGINITPPPANIISKEAIVKIKQSIERVAKRLLISNYARIDIFYNVLSGKIIVIEANTLPALTPSTVIYHQALVEKGITEPVTFLEKIIQLKGEVGVTTSLIEMAR